MPDSLPDDSSPVADIQRPAVRFQLLTTSNRARRGRIHTPHGTIETPAFMPVGTRATVKGLTVDQVATTGTEIVLANTYHLLLRPGPDVVAELGGLHQMMNWHKPILTDSGGFQVFSLASLGKLDDDGITFQSHIDGAKIRLTPEISIDVQEKLGADIIMAFDECPPLPCDDATMTRAVERTVRWAARCKAAQTRTDQGLYGIVQGGLDVTYRTKCLEALQEIDFPGYALGGLSVGEPPPQMWAFLDEFAHRMPADRPRYLMGVGTPTDLVHAVRAGIDQFDCVLPTRNGRKAYAFTSEGTLRLRNAVHKTDRGPLDPGCDCDTCRSYSRGYLRHLCMVDEVLGATLISLHNVAFYQSLLRTMRTAIEQDQFDRWAAEFLRSPAATSESETSA